MAAKTILLIIDPQVDFTTGTLAVPGAKEDYDRIIKLMNGNKIEFNEIHVSLDTHNKDHIGHSDFWEKKSGDGWVPLQNDENRKDVFMLLSVDENNEIKAQYIPGLDGHPLHPNRKNYQDDVLILRAKKKEYRDYAVEYIKYLNSKVKQTGLAPTIWDTHCVVGTEGHTVASPLKEALDLQETSKVKYHIKGQNNLTEMYSIFGAEYESDEALKIQGPKPNVNGYSNYNLAKDATNKYVALNKELMKTLLNGGNNTVYVCGQARTHCVKESLKHLLEYAVEMGYDTTKIRLLYNMSSPIPGVLDDIDKIPYVTLVEKTDNLDNSDLVVARSNSLKEGIELNRKRKNYQSKHVTPPTKGGKRRRKTKKRHNKKPNKKGTKKRHHKKTKKRKVRKTKKNKTRKR